MLILGALFAFGTSWIHSFVAQRHGNPGRPLERSGLLLAALMLEWPVLAMVTLWALSYAGATHWE